MRVLNWKSKQHKSVEDRKDLLPTQQKSTIHLQQYARITIAPENIPPPPIPAMARPTMKALLLGAMPQTKELAKVSDWTRN
jgi:hypothetical protein